ncbi:hypothetical protein [Bacillus sp. 165]|nr:hypothetical protein [Bacillus sp. 165]MBO9128157.1 hypothetical protein [Bacillus sp. 165]
MDYLFEAIGIILGVLFPLACVVWFLKELIKNLGDPHTVTPLPAGEGED